MELNENSALHLVGKGARERMEEGVLRLFKKVNLVT